MKNYRLGLFIFVFLSLAIAVSLMLLGQETRTNSQAATPSTTFYAYNTHPNYWPAGSNLWTAKKYTWVSTSKYPVEHYNNYWIWSGRLYVPDTGHRSLIYEKYLNDTSKGSKEWEMWYGQIDSFAKVYKYGGPTEPQTKTVFANKSLCQTANVANAGILWPNLTTTDDSEYVPQSVRYPSGYCTDPYPNGDYIAIKMIENWSTANSTYRRSKCNALIPSSTAPTTYSICRYSKYVGVVQQRYVISKDIGATGPKYGHGCEMAIYAYGYPYSSLNHYRNWFRNGELRFSDYFSTDSMRLDIVKSPDDNSWWNSNCASAWTAVPNWFYTGIYKSDSSTPYTDYGGY